MTFRSVYRCRHCKEPAREVHVIGDRNVHVRVTHLKGCEFWQMIQEKWPVLVDMMRPRSFQW